MAQLLITNISQFQNLCSKKDTVDDGYDLVQSYSRNIDDMFIPFKTLLTQVFLLNKIDLENQQQLIKMFKELGTLIDEATVLVKTWNQTKSKFYFVLQIEPVIAKIHGSVLESCSLLISQFQFLEDESLIHHVQLCTRKIKDTVFINVSDMIQRSTQDRIRKKHPSSDKLNGITSPLNLSTPSELLMEMVTLKNLRLELKPGGETHENIDHMIQLVTYIHDRCVEKHKVQTINNIRISSELCCPLSLQFMPDPVIVASGQTYERRFIKNWLDRGFRVCPKTQQTLEHDNLIPNYTVKALIDNFCAKHNLKVTQEDNGGIGRLRKSFDQSDHHLSQATWTKASTETESSTSYQQSTISIGSDDDTSQSGYRSSSPLCSRNGEIYPNSRSAEENGSSKYSPKILSRQLPSLSPVEIKTYSIIEDMMRSDVDIKMHRDATDALRNLTKINTNERIMIANCGAIDALVALLGSTSDSKTQENIITTLFNLSIDVKDNKMKIGSSVCINLLVHALHTGNSVAKANSAATLYNLATIDTKTNMKIGRSGAIKALVELLGNGTPRGKRDATSALFHLSMSRENKTRIVEARGVRYLVELIDPTVGLIDKAVTILANLASTHEGRISIGQEGGIPVLVDVVELGTARGKENAAATLLQLCSSQSSFCGEVIQEGAIPPLAALSRNGSPRGKEKANAILCYLQNHGNGRRER